MAIDDKKNSSLDDEYQFPKDEYVSSDKMHISDDESLHVEETGPVSARKSRAKWTSYVRRIPVLKNKRIITVIAILVLLIVVLRIFHSDKKAPPAPTPVAQTETTAPVQQPDYNALNALQAHSSRTESQLKELQGQMTDLQNMLDQSQAANQQLQKNVTTLTGQVNALSEQVAEVMANQYTPRGKRVVYHLRAVVPNRAWITRNNGQTVSVTVGNKLSHYGTIRMIDSANGIVYTSSGRKIRYGLNDY